MSLKDLFNNPNLKSVTSASLQDVIDDTESLGYIESYVKEQKMQRLQTLLVTTKVVMPINMIFQKTEKTTSKLAA